jgi:hypothetical protein
MARFPSSKNNVPDIDLTVSDEVCFSRAYKIARRLNRSELIESHLAHGDAFYRIRREAMRMAQTNKPEGARYSVAMSQLMAERHAWISDHPGHRRDVGDQRG